MIDTDPVRRSVPLLQQITDPQVLVLITYRSTYIYNSLQKGDMLLSSNQTLEIKVFLNFFIFNGRIRIREAQKLPDPAPEHYFLNNIK